MKKNELRTKKKQASEANASEADELIKEFLVQGYLHNAKTEEILEEYLEKKNIDD